MKQYSREDMKRESELSVKMSRMEDAYIDEKNPDNLQVIKNDIRKVFDEIFDLRIKLDIYVKTADKEGIISGIIELLDSKRKIGGRIGEERNEKENL